MTTEKLKRCRICLAENVRMYVVTSKNLQEVYEKLTDVPFVTEDRRPVLACFFCFSKLKQCYKLQRKCLETEELLAPFLNNNYETKPLLSEGLLEFSNVFNITPTVNISIVDECRAESMASKELQTVCERLPNVIELKKEQQSDGELEPEKVDDDVPLMELKIEIEEREVSENRQRACENTSAMTRDNDDVCDGPGELLEPKEEYQSDDLEPENVDDDVPLKELKIEIEEQELSENRQRPFETTSAAVEKLDNAVTAEQTDRGKSDSKLTLMIENSMSKPDTYIKDSYKCGQRSFNPEKKYIQHNNTQTAETPYKCDLCQRFFSKQSGLTKHKRIHTGEKPYQCHLCPRSFIEKSALNNHSRVHTGEKPFKCHICHCYFRHTGTLRTHLRQHSGVKAYKCDICQRSFGEKSTLTNHIRIHTGEKPFKCNICPSSFRQNNHLATHIRQHTGEKPYKCTICQRSFNQKCDLTKHIRIHTGEKPYKCDECERSFIQKSALTKHRRIHTGEEPYKCDVCARSFRDKRNLIKHIC